MLFIQDALREPVIEIRERSCYGKLGSKRNFARIENAMQENTAGTELVKFLSEISVFMA